MYKGHSKGDLFKVDHSSQFNSADAFLALYFNRKKEMQHVAKHQQKKQMKAYTTFALYSDMFQCRLALL